MRKLYFLLPQTAGLSGGGLSAELNTCALARQICSAQVVTYRQKEAKHLFLPDILPNSSPQTSIFVIGWGFDVPKIIPKLKGQNVIYHAHSANYGFKIPPEIPIVTVSRNTMGYWGEQAANGLIYYLPNQIGDEFCNLNQPRDLDILVQTRKSSQYLLQQLIPALQSRYRVEIIDSYVPDLAALFNRSKIYLYDSAEYWAVSGVTEGFGLPPLEALACGCQVFSSLNHGLSDYLDPGFNCQKIAGYSLEYDLQRIEQAISQPRKFPESLLAQYRSEHLVAKLKVILTEIDHFFDWRATASKLSKEQFQARIKIKSLDNRRIFALKLARIIRKLPQKLNRN
ncbi:glycosyltransferase [Pleurocapsales cyanobacterium LEGE 10410]|nr:glycosyltransferase [Pleurocapsales cyanobacterium LEGE 10410]